MKTSSRLTLAAEQMSRRGTAESRYLCQATSSVSSLISTCAMSSDRFFLGVRIKISLYYLYSCI